jgi:hypothetical protein
VRISRALAWSILLLALSTASLLRQFHDRIPQAPHMDPALGSLLFSAIVLLLLVSRRESGVGAVPGPGVRLGSLTPILLMLLVEKWASLFLYPLAFDALAPRHTHPALLDAAFRTSAGVGLILTCLLVARLSRPTQRKTWRRARPIRWPIAALGASLVIAGTYAALSLLSAALGSGPRLGLPRASALLAWVLIGQAVLAFAEELYYRGLLLAELTRLAPRLGVRSAVGRRWLALLLTAGLFGGEHLTLGPPWDSALRQLVFSVALGLLLGMLVTLSTNLHFVGAIHAWINWLLLGAAPHLVDDAGQPALAPGTYIAVTLILAFLLAYGFRRWRSTRRLVAPDGAPGAQP